MGSRRVFPLSVDASSSSAVARSQPPPPKSPAHRPPTGHGSIDLARPPTGGSRRMELTMMAKEDYTGTVEGQERLQRQEERSRMREEELLVIRIVEAEKEAARKLQREKELEEEKKIKEQYLAKIRAQREQQEKVEDVLGHGMQQEMFAERERQRQIAAEQEEWRLFQEREQEKQREATQLRRADMAQQYEQDKQRRIQIHKLQKERAAQIAERKELQNQKFKLKKTRLTQKVETKLSPQHSTVLSVTDHSPAMQATLKSGDLLVEFGGIVSSTPKCLMAMAECVQKNVNTPIPVVLLRSVETPDEHFEELRVSLCPRKWGGKGLLGCQLSPFKWPEKIFDPVEPQKSERDISITSTADLSSSDEGATTVSACEECYYTTLTTALHAAALSGHVSCLEALLNSLQNGDGGGYSASDYLDWRDEDGRTPLFYACYAGQLDAKLTCWLRILKSECHWLMLVFVMTLRVFTIYAKNTQTSWTMRMYVVTPTACSSVAGTPGGVEVLITYLPSIALYITNEDGQNAAELARSNGNEDVAAFLDSVMAAAETRTNRNLEVWTTALKGL
ncbi:Ankyrin repeat-containing domain [Phytophthora cactorum]|nr:Ankyrin repeat-containing domain [Phytophthora cactorum]